MLPRRHPQSPNDKLVAEIPAEKASQCDVQCKVLVGTSTQSSQFLVVEKAVRLPKFAAYQILSPEAGRAAGGLSKVTCVIKDRCQRVLARVSCGCR